MSYSKRQLIEAAFTELGMSPYAFELSVDQLEAALIRLDSMLAEWNNRNLHISYNGPNIPGASTLDSDSGLPDKAWEAVITNLALRVAPSYGKTVSIDTRINARHSLNTILSGAATPSEMKMTTIPAGAGNKHIDEPFISETPEIVSNGVNTTLPFEE